MLAAAIFCFIVALGMVTGFSGDDAAETFLDSVSDGTREVGSNVFEETSDIETWGTRDLGEIVEVLSTIVSF